MAIQHSKHLCPLMLAAAMILAGCVTTASLKRRTAAASAKTANWISHCEAEAGISAPPLARASDESEAPASDSTVHSTKLDDYTALKYEQVLQKKADPALGRVMECGDRVEKKCVDDAEKEANKLAASSCPDLSAYVKNSDMRKARAEAKKAKEEGQAKEARMKAREADYNRRVKENAARDEHEKAEAEFKKKQEAEHQSAMVRTMRSNGATHVILGQAFGVPDYMACKQQLDEGTYICQKACIVTIGDYERTLNGANVPCISGKMAEQFVLLMKDQPGSQMLYAGGWYLGVVRGADTELATVYGGKLPAAQWIQKGSVSYAYGTNGVAH